MDISVRENTKIHTVLTSGLQWCEDNMNYVTVWLRYNTFQNNSTVKLNKYYLITQFKNVKTWDFNENSTLTFKDKNIISLGTFMSYDIEAVIQVQTQSA